MMVLPLTEYKTESGHEDLNFLLLKITTSLGNNTPKLISGNLSKPPFLANMSSQLFQQVAAAASPHLRTPPKSVIQYPWSAVRFGTSEISLQPLPVAGS